jgi:hypothetical protein
MRVIADFFNEKLIISQTPVLGFDHISTHSLRTCQLLSTIYHQ